jgi:hypothetical protein
VGVRRGWTHGGSYIHFDIGLFSSGLREAFGVWEGKARHVERLRCWTTGSHKERIRLPLLTEHWYTHPPPDRLTHYLEGHADLIPNLYPSFSCITIVHIYIAPFSPYTPSMRQPTCKQSVSAAPSGTLPHAIRIHGRLQTPLPPSSRKHWPRGEDAEYFGHLACSGLRQGRRPRVSYGRRGEVSPHFANAEQWSI